MKKYATLFLAAALMFGFVACQEESAQQEEAAANSTAVATTADQAPAAAPTATPQPANMPKKPEFQEQAEAMPRTTVAFESEEFNYGKVTSGDKVTHQFRFTNTGSEPLTLTRVRASCGCTTPSWSKEPIAPGEDGFIDVAFNTAGKSGIQNKTVTVTGNFDGNINKVLRITGEVAKAQ